eukprot:TRINITY_DN6515_c0_g2_i7.p1 TRINITY_DN6515_c0_g2~~TRINITY_DN6515_c0_g2_i7.p1  ORF type:complete len:729 (+),score=206.11 TRINITY_DN6515_c0_g2_i7:138-2324(+)
MCIRDSSETITHCNAAVEHLTAKKIGLPDPLQHGNTYMLRAQANLHKHSWDGAAEDFQEAREQFGATYETVGLSRPEMLERLDGDVSKSLAEVQKCGAFKTGVAALRGEAASLQGLATVLMSRNGGDLSKDQAPKVVNWQAEALLIFGKIGDLGSAGTTARAIAAVHLDHGNYDQAAQAAASAATSFLMSNKMAESCQSMRLQANAKFKSGDSAGCMQLLQSGMELAAGHNLPSEMAQCAGFLADLHSNGEDQRKGYIIAANGFEACGMTHEMARVLVKLAESKVMTYMMDMTAWQSAMQGGSVEESSLIKEADIEIKRAMPELSSLQEPVGLGHGLYVLATVNMLQGDVEGAPKHFQTALNLPEWCEAMPKKAAQAKLFLERCASFGGSSSNLTGAELRRKEAEERKEAREVRLAAKREEMRLEEEAVEKEFREKQERRRRMRELSDSDSDSEEEEQAAQEKAAQEKAAREQAEQQKAAEHAAKEQAAQHKAAQDALVKEEEERTAQHDAASEQAVQAKPAVKEEAAVLESVLEAVTKLQPRNETAPAEPKPESDKDRRARFDKLCAERNKERKQRQQAAEAWAAQQIQAAKSEDDVVEPEPSTLRASTVQAESVVVPENPVKCEAVQSRQAQAGCVSPTAASVLEGEQPAWFAEWLEEEERLVVDIAFPGVDSVSSLELDCSEEELEVSGGGYHLRLLFGGRMDDESIGAKFDASCGKLTVSLNRL